MPNRDVMNNLINAYNNTVGRIPNAPTLERGSGYIHPINDDPYYVDNIVARDANGERLGFLGVDKPYVMPGNTYRAALDFGDPYRGAKDYTLNTPFGELGYGYEGETNYGYFQPNDRTQNYINALMNLLR